MFASVLTDCRLLGVFASDQRHRRIQAQRLLDHQLHVVQAVQLLQSYALVALVADHPADLLHALALHVRILGNVVQAERDTRCGGVVTLLVISVEKASLLRRLRIVDLPQT